MHSQWMDAKAYQAPRLYNFFHAKLNQAWNSNFPEKLKMKNKDCSCAKLSDTVFILLINGPKREKTCLQSWTQTSFFSNKE